VVPHERLQFRVRRVLVAAAVAVPTCALLAWLLLLCPQWVSFAALLTGLVVFHAFELGRKWVGLFGGILMFAGVVAAVLNGALK